MSDRKQKFPKGKFTIPKNKHPKMPLWQKILLFIALGFFFSTIFGNNGDAINITEEDVSLTEFQSLLEDGTFDEVRMQTGINPSVVTGVVIGTDIETGAESEVQYVASLPEQYEDELVSDVLSFNVPFEVTKKEVTLLQFIFGLWPYFLIGGLLVFLVIRMNRGGIGAAGKFTKTKALTKDMPEVSFEDVAGVDDALLELVEIVDFLKSPDKFRALGAKIPKGVLLVGPPGCGKTLMAQAVAGEADVPFFAISGSDFVEMFVGVGAGRVRDLFAQAKDASPSIVFIDEIDAVGRRRGTGLGGGHDEREQALNQLLVELDGFEENKGVILIGSTNRPDILDPALLRPGRFDRQVQVDRPDIEGRKKILEVHAKGKPLSELKDLDLVAQGTTGFTGADLASVVNEAAILSARWGRETIDLDSLSEAIDRVIAGPKSTKKMSDKDRKLTAYHEAGHTLTGHALQHHPPIGKVTIIGRGNAGGYTMPLSEDKRYLRRSELLAMITMALGGRVAEEIIFGEPSSGSSNDQEKATEFARKFVAEYGFSSKLGIARFAESGEDVFLGYSAARQRNHSDATESLIDAEIRAILEQSREEAFEILSAQCDSLELLAAELLEKETLHEEGISMLLKNVPKYVPSYGEDANLNGEVDEREKTRGFVRILKKEEA